MTSFLIRTNKFLGRRLLSSSVWFEAEGLARRYYYKLDDRGSLYLFNTKYKNVSTSLRDKKFLKQFFGSLRPLDPPKTVLGTQFHLVSLCGKEESYLEVLDDERVALCFTDISATGKELMYARDEMREPFDPGSLRMGADTGKLYHPIILHRHLGKKIDTADSRDRPFYGLLHPHLANKLLKDTLRPGEEGTFEFDYCGATYTIDLLNRKEPKA